MDKTTTLFLSLFLTILYNNERHFFLSALIVLYHSLSIHLYFCCLPSTANEACLFSFLRELTCPYHMSEISHFQQVWWLLTKCLASLSSEFLCFILFMSGTLIIFRHMRSSTEEVIYVSLNNHINKYWRKRKVMFSTRIKNRIIFLNASASDRIYTQYCL